MRRRTWSLRPSRINRSFFRASSKLRYVKKPTSSSMKTMGMLSGTETIAQKFASGPMRGQLPERTGAVNVRQPVAQGDRLLDRPRTSCQEVSSLLSALQQRELNAGRQSRHPRSRERKLHLVAARHPLPRGLGRDPHLLRGRGRRDPPPSLPPRPLRAADQLQGGLSHRVHGGRRLREVDEVAARLDRAHPGYALRAARHLHAPRLHAALARPREQVQVPLPRLGVHEGRRQLRRPDAPAAGARQDRARRRRPARRRQGVPLPLRAWPVGRSQRVREVHRSLNVPDPEKRRTSLGDIVTNNYVWRSIFRHGYADTPRNRVLQVSANVWLHLHPSKMRRHGIRYRHTWCAGGLTFLLYLCTVVTGVVLMFYYRPTGEYAYWDVKYLDFDIPFGMIMRNMHRWAAHGMVIFIWLHMFRVFMTGSYKPPREFNWVVGVNLLTLTLLLSFTGYLLPWDQLAIWAVTVGTNMARATPLLGNEGPFGPELGMTPRYDARALLTAGTVVGSPTLLRFYVLHCIFIPIIASILMILHFWRIRKDGGISGPL